MARKRARTRQQWQDELDREIVNETARLKTLRYDETAKLWVEADACGDLRSYAHYCVAALCCCDGKAYDGRVSIRDEQVITIRLLARYVFSTGANVVRANVTRTSLRDLIIAKIDRDGPVPEV